MPSRHELLSPPHARALLMTCALALVIGCDRNKKEGGADETPVVAAQPSTPQPENEITLDDVPKVEDHGAAAQPDHAHPVYAVHVRPTEDQTTRAWIEINDLTDDERQSLREMAPSFNSEQGEVIVPPSTPGLPARVVARTQYTLAQKGAAQTVNAKMVGFTYYTGASEDHFIVVAKPAQPLDAQKGDVVATPGEGVKLAYEPLTTIAPDDALYKAALEHLPAYLKETLRPDELALIPRSFPEKSVTLVRGGELHGHHAVLALDYQPEPDDVAANRLSALLFLDEAGKVDGILEAPAARIEHFEPLGLITTPSTPRGELVYMSSYYEGSYIYMLSFDEAGKPVLTLLEGDGA